MRGRLSSVIAVNLGKATMAHKPVVIKVGRDAGTGQFKTVEAARRDKQGSVVETAKIPAHSTGNKKK